MRLLLCSLKSGKWRAYINVERKHLHLGTFPTFEEAAAARKAFDDARALPG
jgi:hypothetical protein